MIKVKLKKMMLAQRANDYLKTLGYVSIAFSWIKILEVSFKDYDKIKNSMK